MGVGARHPWRVGPDLEVLRERLLKGGEGAPLRLRRGTGPPGGRVTAVRGGSGHRVTAALYQSPRCVRLTRHHFFGFCRFFGICRFFGFFGFFGRVLREAVRLGRRRQGGRVRSGHPGLVRPDHGTSPHGGTGRERDAGFLVRAVPSGRRVEGPAQAGSSGRPAVGGGVGAVHRHFRGGVGALGDTGRRRRSGDIASRPAAPERSGRPGRAGPPRLGQRRGHLGGTRVRTRRVRMVGRQPRGHRFRPAAGAGLSECRRPRHHHGSSVVLDAFRDGPELRLRTGRVRHRPDRDRRAARVRERQVVASLRGMPELEVVSRLAAELDAVR